MAEQSGNSDTSTAQSTPPARGATGLTRKITSRTRHFNPRPPRGGRPPWDGYSCFRGHFNPRPREGGDFKTHYNGSVHKISIHAPARGATPSHNCCSKPETISIHAPARGATFSGGILAGGKTFQSTPPRGGRLAAAVVMGALLLFQSTPPRGGRHQFRHSYATIMYISIHAPARGATVVAVHNTVLAVFQSTPPRGGRQQRCTVLPADL